MHEVGQVEDALLSPRIPLTNGAPFNAPFPLAGQVASALCVFTLFIASSWMFYLPKWAKFNIPQFQMPK